jgi:hypothetical protein
MYGARWRDGLAWDTSPPPRDESRSYAFISFRYVDAKVRHPRQEAWPPASPFLAFLF